MELHGVCPWCGRSKLYYNPQKNLYICFHGGCERKGRGMPPVTTWLGVNDKVASVDVELPKGLKLFDARKDSLIVHRIKRYLLSHRVTYNVAEKAGLLYSNTSWVLPFYDHRGVLLYYQERSMFGPKAFKNAQADKGSFIAMTKKNPSRILLVESAISALRMSHLMPTGAFLGKATKKQIKTLMLRRISRDHPHFLEEVVIMLDADADDSALNLFRVLQRESNGVIRWIRLPYGDPCNFDDFFLMQLLEKQGVVLK